MNKETFLIQLEKLLYDISKDERDEAMDFYRSYFEDAGVENEALVLEELESPQAIAASIKEGLNAGGDMSAFLKNPPQVREEAAQSRSYTYEYGKQKKNEEGIKNDSASQNTSFDQSFYTSRESQDTSSDGTSGKAFYRRYDQYEKKDSKMGGMDRRTKLILLIVLAVCTLPVWGSIVSGVLGIVGVIIAAVVVLGICSVGGVIGGIVCAVIGIIKLCMLSIVRGLVTLGIGMLLVAGGGLSIVLLLLLCGKLLPWAVSQGLQLCRRLFKFVGRSMA